MHPIFSIDGAKKESVIGYLLQMGDLAEIGGRFVWIFFQKGNIAKAVQWNHAIEKNELSDHITDL